MNDIQQINARVTAEGIADYLATALHASVERHGKEYEIKGQGGLYINAETGQISKPGEGKGAGCQGIIGAFIYANTGKWKATGKEFADILHKAADYVGYALPSNGNGKPAATPDKPKQHIEIDFNRPTKIYSYTDEDGQEVFQNCRYEFDKAGNRLVKKEFRQRHKDKNGDWTWNLNGVRRVPYKLQDIMQAATGFYDCEGEKDVETLNALGVIATNIGKDESAWKEFAEFGKGKRVVVCEDNDKAGRVQAQTRARFWYKAGATVKILSFQEMPEKSDVTDWIESDPANHDIFELENRVQLTPEYTPLQDVLVDLFHEPKPRKSLVEIDRQNILSEGNIAGIVSGIGRGKSHLIEMIAALAIAPGCEEHGHIKISLASHEKCILIDTERTRDDCFYALKRIWRRTGQRKELLTPDCSQFKQFQILTTSDIEKDKRKERLLEAMETPGVKLLLIDGALDFVMNPNDIAECTDFADWLFMQANRHDIGILFTLHGNRNDDSGKGKGWIGDALQRKSTAFLMLKKHEKYPEVRVLTTEFENVKVRHGRDDGLNVAMAWDADLNAFRFIPYEKGDGQPTQQELFKYCFVINQADRLQKKDLAGAYMKAARVAQRTAYRHIDNAVGVCLEIENLNGTPFYRFTDNF